MCGIAGFLHFDSEQQADPKALQKMTDCIVHRGPDQEGFFVDKNLGIGHRRLSIIDLATGEQPMSSEDKNIVLAFNGEIYNYIELRSELQTYGHHFSTDSDTEVIIKAYQHWGIDCQQHFNGMWAFVLWDNRTKELFISRDRIGEKPLFYTTYNNTFVFGSELKSLFAYGVDKNINTEVIELYLFLTYIPTPYTFYKGVHKLRPGHFLRISGNTVREIKYWDLPDADENNLLKNEKAVYENFSRLLQDAVSLRMRSDVPFGAFLSGGLDSSSIVGLMSKLSRLPVETFTIGFKEKAFDESALAEEVATHFKANFNLLTLVPDSFERSKAKVVKHFDEPFGDSSAIATGIVSAFASEKVKMVLTGDGGDEVLSGYNSYLGLKIVEKYRRLPKALQHTIPIGLRGIAQITRGRLRYKINKAANVSQTATLDFEQRLIHKMAYTDYQTIKSLVKDLQGFTIEDFISDFFKTRNAKGEMARLMHFDYKHSLPDDYLVKVDRMSMASSIETRLPFLDHRLIEFMSTVHPNIKIQGWKTKAVLRETVGKELPEKLLSAPKKGFGVPLREWFKAGSFDRYQHELLEIPKLDKSALTKIFEENKTGTNDNGNFIWTLLILGSFLSDKQVSVS